MTIILNAKETHWFVKCCLDPYGFHTLAKWTSQMAKSIWQNNQIE